MVSDLANRIADEDVVLLGGLGISLRLDELLVDRLEICERELGIDRFDVVERVDAASHVGHVIVFETAHDVGDRVRFANIREEFVPESLAFRGPRDQSGNVDEFHGRGYELFRPDDARKHPEPRVRDRDDANVWIDRAERVVLGRDLGRGQRIEQGGFANVGQADDTAADSQSSAPRVQLFHGRLEPGLGQNLEHGNRLIDIFHQCGLGL